MYNVKATLLQSGQEPGNFEFSRKIYIVLYNTDFNKIFMGNIK